MGDSTNLITATGLRATPLEGQGPVVKSRHVCENRDRSVVSHNRILGKRLFIPLFLAAASALQATAVENEAVTSQKNDTSPATVTQTKVKQVANQNDVDFVIAEVRKQLDSNPATEIVDLSIDPDYHGALDTFLVNAVLDDHGRKLSLGVMVTVRRNAEGRQASMGYID